jgi:hypothetical protein
VTTIDEYSSKLKELGTGVLYPFADWPNRAVPRVAIGVYTIWEGHKLIYVGMSGTNLPPDEVVEPTQKHGKPVGLYTRLHSHFKGDRAGDKFCIYVCDRLVLPSLNSDDLVRIGSGELSLDNLTRIYIVKNLAYRFVVVDSKEIAFELERIIKQGKLSAGKPFLNPL